MFSTRKQTSSSTRYVRHVKLGETSLRRNVREITRMAAECSLVAVAATTSVFIIADRSDVKALSTCWSCSYLTRDVTVSSRLSGQAACAQEQRGALYVVLRFRRDLLRAYGVMAKSIMHAAGGRRKRHAYGLWYTTRSDRRRETSCAQTSVLKFRNFKISKKKNNKNSIRTNTNRPDGLNRVM